MIPLADSLIRNALPSSFPYIDSLLFGEWFNYAGNFGHGSEAYWLTEISGIPFGLFNDMLGEPYPANPWKGMSFGMVPRYGAVTGGGQTNNTAMWRAWDELALTNATMFGWWNRSSPVQLLPAGSATSCEKVFATAYVVSGVRIVISIASWSEQPVANCTLKINWYGLGLSDNTANASLAAPQVAGFQNETRFGPGTPIPVRSSEGWLLVVEPDAGT